MLEWVINILNGHSTFNHRFTNAIHVLIPIVKGTFYTLPLCATKCYDICSFNYDISSSAVFHWNDFYFVIKHICFVRIEWISRITEIANKLLWGKKHGMLGKRRNLKELFHSQFNRLIFESIEFDESNQLILLCECMNGMTRHNFTRFPLSLSHKMFKFIGRLV